MISRLVFEQAIHMQPYEALEPAVLCELVYVLFVCIACVHVNIA